MTILNIVTNSKLQLVGDTNPLPWQIYVLAGLTLIWSRGTSSPTITQTTSYQYG